MKRITVTTSLTLIHAIISWLLFLKSLSYGMHRFDTSELPSLGEKIINVISAVLLWPIFYPLARWGGRAFHNIFQGLLGYIPLIINSFIWALAIYWVLERIMIKKNT